MHSISFEWHSTQGAFTIYIYNFSHIFDHPLTLVYNFYAINIYKFSGFLTTHPPSIVNANCERPRRQRSQSVSSTSRERHKDVSPDKYPRHTHPRRPSSRLHRHGHILRLLTIIICLLGCHLMSFLQPKQSGNLQRLVHEKLERIKT